MQEYVFSLTCILPYKGKNRRLSPYTEEYGQRKPV